MSLYDLFNFLGYWVMLINNFIFIREVLNLKSYTANYIRFHGQKNENINKKRYLLVLWIAAVIFVLTTVQFFSGVVMNKLVGYWFTDGADNYFGFAVLAPIVFIAFCLMLKEEPFTHLDLFTPGYAISLVFFKIACYFADCCAGMTTETAFWYPDGVKNKFPVQLLEAFIALIIYITLLSIRKKLRIGTVHPMYLILYSGTRFFTEFLREEDNVIGSLKLYHIMCIFGVLIGLTECYFISIYGNKLVNITNEWCKKPYNLHCKKVNDDI